MMFAFLHRCPCLCPFRSPRRADSRPSLWCTASVTPSLDGCSCFWWDSCQVLFFECTVCFHMHVQEKSWTFNLRGVASGTSTHCCWYFLVIASHTTNQLPLRYLNPLRTKRSLWRKPRMTSLNLRIFWKTWQHSAWLNSSAPGVDKNMKLNHLKADVWLFWGFFFSYFSWKTLNAWIF